LTYVRGPFRGGWKNRTDALAAALCASPSGLDALVSDRSWGRTVPAREEWPRQWELEHPVEDVPEFESEGSAKRREKKARRRHMHRERRLGFNPAPGYQSWQWTRQNWRSVLRKGNKLDWSKKCGAKGTRLPGDKPSLCLPLFVIETLNRTAEGRKILMEQVRKKERAKKGQRVPWHPKIRELHRIVEQMTEKDDPRLKKRGNPPHLCARLSVLRPQLAAAANEAIQGFSWDEGGGACDQVSMAMGGVLAEAGYDTLEGGHDGDDHAWLIAYDERARQACGVDVRPTVYEEGAGYSWAPIPGAVVQPGDVELWPISFEDIEPGLEFEENPSYWGERALPHPGEIYIDYWPCEGTAERVVCGRDGSNYHQDGMPFYPIEDPEGFYGVHTGDPEEWLPILARDGYCDGDAYFYDLDCDAAWGGGYPLWYMEDPHVWDRTYLPDSQLLFGKHERLPARYVRRVRVVPEDKIEPADLPPGSIPWEDE